ncbi:MAG TPA: hypothetical protein VF718_02705, partial [Allosphingosinicella sp.]
MEFLLLLGLGALLAYTLSLAARVKHLEALIRHGAGDSRDATPDPLFDGRPALDLPPRPLPGPLPAEPQAEPAGRLEPEPAPDDGADVRETLAGFFE